MPSTNTKFGFKVMSLLFKIRDTYYSREKVLSEVGLKPGDHVLDFGCGSGSYIRGTSSLIGTSGKYYALDASPFSIEAVDKMVERFNLQQVQTIQSDLSTALEDESVDVVLVYDIFHMIKDQQALLRELNRVLKPEGIFSFSDHHMKEADIISGITKEGLFKLSEKGKKTYSFAKN